MPMGDFVFSLLLVLQRQMVSAQNPKLKVHFLAYHKKAANVPSINSALVENGLDPLVRPIHFYEDGNRASEANAVDEFLAEVHKEPNSPTLQHVLLVYPNEPVWDGTYNLYQPIFHGNTLVLWYTTFMVNGTLGPEGTVVVNVDERSGGLLVGKRFCYLSQSSSQPKTIQPLMYGYANGYVRYYGFLDGIQQFCGQKGHTVLEPIMLQKGTGWDDAARTAMKSVFIENPLVDSVFCPDDDMATGVAQAASEVRQGNLSGLLMNAWQYGEANIPYLEQGLMYADVDSSVEDLNFKLGQFLANLNLQRLPRSVLNPVILRVPSMNGLIKDELMAVYNKEDKPPSSGAVTVSFDFSLKALLNVDYRAKSIEILLDVEPRWVDARLGFSSKRHMGKINYVKEEVWLPRYVFDNIIELKEESFYTITGDSAGNMVYGRRVHGIFECKDMSLRKFPYDEHLCNVDVVSSFDSSVSRFQSAAAMVEAKGGDSFLINSVSASAIENSRHSAVSFKMLLERDLSPYLVSHILPATIAVLLSTVVFWLPETAVPARVTLNVVMLLTTVNLWSTVPRVGTVMDSFFMANLFFLFVVFGVSIFAEQKTGCHGLKGFFGGPETKQADKFGRRAIPALYVICVVCVLLFGKVI